jgi:hypothetical protein
MAACPAGWHRGLVLSSRVARLSLLTIVAALLAVASTSPAASAAMQRYASPTGSGDDCSSAKPCDIRKAVEGASAGDEVIVAPGDYELTATLDATKGITIHGVTGEPRPLLEFSGPGQEGVDLTDGTLRYVRIEQAAGTYALGVLDSTVDQVIARGPDLPGVTTVWVADSMFRNSIVVAPGVNGIAVQTTSIVVPRSGTYRNVTAIAPGTGGIALLAWAGNTTGHTNVLARNVIARGGPGGYSLKAHVGNPAASATITVDHSNWLGGLKVGAQAAIVDGGGNQTAAPYFVDAAAGDYRQANGSPTIDAGLSEFVDGPLDADGDPRQIGPIDIGADEFVVVPGATTGPASAVTDRSATLSGSVDANGAPTSYRFEYGPTTAYGSSTPAADAGSGLAVATATLGSLSPETTYHYRVVATNAGGTTNGADQTFTTAAAAQPAPPSPPSSAPPAFAGVNLLSTRLSFGGRFITLRLSCPAGTVGRCSGRTTLTARRRASSGPAAAVALGRAPFSIAAGGRSSVRLRVSRAGRRLLSQVRRLRAKDTTAARDEAGQSRTTAAAVTIRHRHR